MAWREVPLEENKWREVPIDEQQSPLVTGVKHIAQMGSGGFSDELAGLFEGGGQAVGLKGLGGPMKDISFDDNGPTLDWETLRDAYRRGRNLERESLKKGAEQNPKSAFVGDIIGGSVSPLNKIASGMSAIKGGATLGGIYGLGGSESEDVIGLAKDTALGAGLGGAIGGAVDVAAPYIDKGVKYAGGKLKDIAENRAFKALGPYQKDTVKAFDKDQINKIGRTALDEGVITNVPRGYETLAERASNAKEIAGKNVGDYIERLAEAEKAFQQKGQSVMPGFTSGLDRKAIADSMRKDLLNPNVDIPGVAAKNERIENLISQFANGEEKSIPLLKAEMLKRSVNKEINFNRLKGADIPLEEQVQRSLSNKLKTGVEDYADILDKALNNPNAPNKIISGPSSRGFKDVKNIYGNLDAIEKMTNTRSAKEFANRMVSPSDYGSAAMGLIQGGPVGAILTGVANQAMRLGGNQVMAKQADNISKALLKSPNMQQLLANNPAAFQAMVQRMLPKQEEQQKPKYDNDAVMQKIKGTKYEQVLNNAKQKGDQSAAAANYVLQSQDQEYRKLLENEGE